MPIEPILGEIYVSAFNFAPKGFLPCNGQLMSISSNSALFSLLGTTYGGNGIQTFALPDYRGRVIAGMGPSMALGQFGGVESVSLINQNLPATPRVGALNGTSGHPTGNVQANLTAQNLAGSLSDANGNSLANAGVASEPMSLFTNTTGAQAAMAAGSVAVDISQVKASLQGIPVQIPGNSSPLSVMQPYLVLNCYIAVQGIYPSRP